MVEHWFNQWVAGSSPVYSPLNSNNYQKMDKVKTSHDYAVFMYNTLKGCKVNSNEILCRRMQTHNANVFEELCDIINSPYDYLQCAKILTSLGKQPLMEA